MGRMPRLETQWHPPYSLPCLYSLRQFPWLRQMINDAKSLATRERY